MDESKLNDLWPIQLNKYLAHSGLCSRRKADLLIKNKEITVNGQLVTNCAHKVNYQDIVKYKNDPIKLEEKVYILLNKPKGYITTTSDEKNRKTILDLIKPDIKQRLYPIGRLDRATTGLVILTNDGTLTQKLAHPSNNISKTYNVVLATPLAVEDLNKIKKGIMLEDGFMKVDSIEFMDNCNTIHVTIHSGKNRIIRRLFEKLDYKILKLDRTSYAGLTQKHLPQGYWRLLTSKEINMLYQLSKDRKSLPKNKKY